MLYCIQQNMLFLSDVRIIHICVIFCYIPLIAATSYYHIRKYKRVLFALFAVVVVGCLVVDPREPVHYLQQQKNQYKYVTIMCIYIHGAYSGIFRMGGRF